MHPQVLAAPARMPACLGMRVTRVRIRASNLVKGSLAWLQPPPHLEDLLALVDEPHGQGQQVRVAQVESVVAAKGEVAGLVLLRRRQRRRRVIHQRQRHDPPVGQRVPSTCRNAGCQPRRTAPREA